MKGSLFTGCDAGGHCSWHPARHDWSVGSPGKLSSHRTNLCSQSAPKVNNITAAL